MHRMHEIQRKVAIKERLIAFFVILSLPVALSHQKNKNISKKHEENKKKKQSGIVGVKN